MIYKKQSWSTYGSGSVSGGRGYVTFWVGTLQTQGIHVGTNGDVSIFESTDSDSFTLGLFHPDDSNSFLLLMPCYFQNEPSGNLPLE